MNSTTYPPAIEHEVEASISSTSLSVSSPECSKWSPSCKSRIPISVARARSERELGRSRRTAEDRHLLSVLRHSIKEGLPFNPLQTTASLSSSSLSSVERTPPLVRITDAKASQSLHHATIERTNMPEETVKCLPYSSPLKTEAYASCSEVTLIALDYHMVRVDKLKIEARARKQPCPKKMVCLDLIMNGRPVQLQFRTTGAGQSTRYRNLASRCRRWFRERLAEALAVFVRFCGVGSLSDEDRKSSLDSSDSSDGSDSRIATDLESRQRQVDETDAQAMREFRRRVYSNSSWSSGSYEVWNEHCAQLPTLADVQLRMPSFIQQRLASVAGSDRSNIQRPNHQNAALRLLTKT